LAAVAAVRVTEDHGLNNEQLVRSLEHDGFGIDSRNIEWIPAEGHVSHEEEEGRLAQLINEARLFERL
jgi:hypothetical protein